LPIPASAWIAEHVARIFDPFFSRRADGVAGTGLGLTIVKNFVERMAGEIRVESAPGRGTRFLIRLPLAESAWENGFVKKKTLLIIDDDAVFNGLLRRQIESMGFAAVGAGTWAEAQQKLGEIEPDAIILDFKLPDSNATKILAEIRNQYPVIVLTGYGSIPNAVNAIREGAADFLTKPVNVDELEMTVRHVLETAELRESNQFYRTQLAAHRPGPMVFDSAAMREVQAMVDAVGPTDTTVLILGESGTGKELVAQAIHDAVREHIGNWSRSTAAACRKACSSRNCSATSAAPSPVPTGRRRA
jgi:ActR/RegA family two-component response regulator